MNIIKDNPKIVIKMKNIVPKFLMMLTDSYLFKLRFNHEVILS